MATFHEVETYEGFQETVKKLDEQKVPIFALFYGAHDSTGKSWCPDCVKAEPVVDKVMKTKASSDMHFLHVNAGDRTSWKDPECKFRTDPRLKLSCIPTLIHWGSSEVLREDECADANKVESFLTAV